MRHPKEKTHRCRGGLRDAVVGVRPFDSTLYRAGYLAVCSVTDVRFGRDCAQAGLLMFRPCCVVELRPAAIGAEAFTDIFVTHLDGEVRIRTREAIESLRAVVPHLNRGRA